MWDCLSRYLIAPDTMRWIIEEGFGVPLSLFDGPSIGYMSKENKIVVLEAQAERHLPELLIYVDSQIQIGLRDDGHDLERRLLSNEVDNFRIYGSSLLVTSGRKLIRYNYENGDEFVSVTRSMKSANKTVQDGYVHLFDAVSSRYNRSASGESGKFLFDLYAKLEDEFPLD